MASARRSGQEDFQRGTPPVSLASRSISPFLRACIITEWSTKDHETDSTGTTILIPRLLLNFNMRLYGNPTAWYLFLATCTTQLAKFSFNHSNGRTHSWRFSTFYKILRAVYSVIRRDKSFLSMCGIFFVRSSKEWRTKPEELSNDTAPT